MALTPEEKKIVEYGKTQGKTQDEVEAAVVRFRATRAPQVESDYIGKGVVDTFASGGQRVARELGDVGMRRGPEQQLEAAQAIGVAGLEALKGAGSIIAEPFRVAYNALPKETRDAIGETAERAFVNAYSALNQKDRRKIEAAATFLKENPQHAQVAQDAADLILNRAGLGAGTATTQAAGASVRGAAKIAEPAGKKLFETVRRTQDTLAPKDREAAVRSLVDAYNESFIENNAATSKALEKIARQETRGDVLVTRSSLVQELAEEGYLPAVEGRLAKFTPVLDDISERQASIANGIDNILERYPDKNIGLSDLQQRAKDSLRRSPQVDADLEKSLADVDRMFDSFRTKYGDTISAFDVNQIRKNMNRRTRAFNTELFTQDSSDAVADAARNVLDEFVPSGVVREANAEIARLFRLEKTARTLDNQRIDVGVVGGQLGRYLGALGGGTLGLTAGLGPGGLVVAGIGAYYGAEMIAKIIRNSRFNERIRQSILDGIRQDESIMQKLLLEANDADATYLLRELRNRPLELPAGSRGAGSRVESGPTIKLPSETDSTRSVREIDRALGDRVRREFNAGTANTTPKLMSPGENPIQL